MGEQDETTRDEAVAAQEPVEDLEVNDAEDVVGGTTASAGGVRAWPPPAPTP